MSLLEEGRYYGMPTVLWYFAFKENAFFNSVHADAMGLEAAGNLFLTPYHYLFSGKKFTPVDREILKDAYLFPREDLLGVEWLKTALAIVALPFSMLIGGALKTISFAFPDARKHHYEILADAKRPMRPASTDNKVLLSYEKVDRAAVRMVRPSHKISAKQRRELAPLFQHVPDAQQKEIATLSKNMSRDILALKDLGALLDAHDIPWWVDCGTLLGVFRHEGMIPWDHDIDVAILQEYHDYVLKLARDPAFAKKYTIMDWSPADQPKTLLKLYVKQTRSLIDIYHYQIQKNGDSEDTVTYLSPYYSKWYMPHSLKIREEFCQISQPFSILFPLKTASFDGVQVHVPNQYETHLKNIYQGELSPSKIWDAKRHQYVQVAGHPYWKKS
jgi:phosphorylcholine metabolism protein LicD